MVNYKLFAAVAAFSMVTHAAEAQTRTNAQRAQDRQMAAVPRCEQPMGTITFAEGENYDFENINLQPPQALLRVVVQRSGCFTIVDRTAASQTAIERERRLALSGELQRNSNLGGGQVRVADFIMLTEVTAANEDASGSRFGGSLRFAGRGLAAVATGGMSEVAVRGAGALNQQNQQNQQRQQTTVSGGLSSQTSEVNTVISIVNLRTTETIVASEGYAAKRDINWNLAASASFGGFVGGGYENTEVGRIVGQSLVNAYAKAVDDMRSVDLAALMPAAAPEAAPIPQPVVQTASRPAARHDEEDFDEAPRPRRPPASRRSAARSQQPVGAEVIRSTIMRDSPAGSAVAQLTAGDTVHPTGEVEDSWIEIEDAEGNVGWVQGDRLMDFD
jgi:hypothetical protein